MGLLRLYLALAVLFSHLEPASGLRLISGQSAVEGFFSLSGFFMAMVLEKRYARSTGVFYLNRFLRLWPAYLLVLLLTAAFLLGWLFYARVGFGSIAAWLDLSQAPGTGAWIALIAASLGILGQDLLVFLFVGPGGGIRFSPDAYSIRGGMSHLVLLPQTWSLGIEAWFYLICPWAVKLSDGVLAAAALASLGLRLGAAGAACGPWISRFFPFECWAFAAGILAWRKREALSRVPGIKAFAWALLACLLLGPWLAWPQFVEAPLSSLACALLAPTLLRWSERRRWDRLGGDLAYPLFLVHLPVMWAFRALAGREFYLAHSLWTLPLSLMASVGIHAAVEAPVERLRRRLQAALL